MKHHFHDHTALVTDKGHWTEPYEEVQIPTYDRLLGIHKERQMSMHLGRSLRMTDVSDVLISLCMDVGERRR